MVRAIIGIWTQLSGGCCRPRGRTSLRPEAVQQDVWDYIEMCYAELSPVESEMQYCQRQAGVQHTSGDRVA